jgi:RimJ/RimL family protein N-acetyltransferase
VPDVFYVLLPPSRGRGAATTAVRLLTDWALGVGYPEVGLVTIRGNHSSERVARRAGFTEGSHFEDDHRGQPVRLTRWIYRPTLTEDALSFKP